MPEGIGRCSSCGSHLAFDQRYCLDCGTRRGPVSDAMKALIAGTIPEGLLAAPAAAAEPDATLVGAALAGGPPRPIFSLPTPRAAGVVVTGLLAFGVMLGSVVSPAAESQAQSPIVVAVSPPASPAAASAAV